LRTENFPVHKNCIGVKILLLNSSQLNKMLNAKEKQQLTERQLSRFAQTAQRDEMR